MKESNSCNYTLISFDYQEEDDLNFRVPDVAVVAVVVDCRHEIMSKKKMSK
jgi:hypothetical protein